MLAGVYTTRTTVELLKGIGFKVVEFGVPKSLDGVRKQIRDVAAAIGESARGDAIVAEMDARLARLSARAHNPPLTAVVPATEWLYGRQGSPRQRTPAARGSRQPRHAPRHRRLPANPARSGGVGAGGRSYSQRRQRRRPSLATQALHHPIVAKLGERLKVISMPSRLWTCAGPSVLDAVELLMTRRIYSSSARPRERAGNAAPAPRHADGSREVLEVGRVARSCRSRHDGLVGLRRLCASRRPAGILGCPAWRAKPAGGGVDPASPPPRSLELVSSGSVWA